MHRAVWLCLGAFLLAGVALGEDFWIKKDYRQWTDEEIKKIMTNSPWAKDVTVSAPATAVGGARRGGGGGPAPSGIDIENPSASRGRSRGGSRPGDDETPTPADVTFSLTMSWRSALPLRKALVKSRLGTATDAPPDAQQLLTKEQEEYVLVVTGPARLGRLMQEANPGSQTLKIGKRTLPAKGMDVQTRAQSADVVILFPRTEPITLDDKEVEVEVKFGPVQAKRKFTLKEMVYNGKLEL
jgi:hypothetical protein